MINVNSALLTDDLTGVHNNYIRGFIYDQPQPPHCKSTPAAAHRWNQVPNGGAVQEPKEHNSLQNLNHQITFFKVITPQQRNHNYFQLGNWAAHNFVYNMFHWGPEVLVRPEWTQAWVNATLEGREEEAFLMWLRSLSLRSQTLHREGIWQHVWVHNLLFVVTPHSTVYWQRE